MAKLYFRYGAMNSGKSTALLQAAFNYEERDQRVLLAKPSVDTKGESTITSRLGLARSVDLLLGDEAQFLTPQQVDDLLRIAVLDSVPVLAYGIRGDFRTRSFPGSGRLMEIAHTLEELKTICRCGRKAMFNARTSDGGMVLDGEQVAIDGEVAYESLCASCYLERSGGQLG